MDNMGAGRNERTNERSKRCIHSRRSIGRVSDPPEVLTAGFIITQSIRVKAPLGLLQVGRA